MRPKGFKNPFEVQKYIDDGEEKEFRQEDRRTAFEVGADEYERCLRKMPVQVRWKGDGKGGVVFDIYPAPVIDEWRKYTLVFIEEEDETT